MDDRDRRLIAAATYAASVGGRGNDGLLRPLGQMDADIAWRAAGLLLSHEPAERPAETQAAKPAEPVEDGWRRWGQSMPPNGARVALAYKYGGGQNGYWVRTIEQWSPSLANHFNASPLAYYIIPAVPELPEYLR